MPRRAKYDPELTTLHLDRGRLQALESVPELIRPRICDADSLLSPARGQHVRIHEDIQYLTAETSTRHSELLVASFSGQINEQERNVARTQSETRRTEHQSVLLHPHLFQNASTGRRQLEFLQPRVQRKAGNCEHQPELLHPRVHRKSGPFGIGAAYQSAIQDEGKHISIRRELDTCHADLLPVDIERLPMRELESCANTRKQEYSYLVRTQSGSNTLTQRSSFFDSSDFCRPCGDAGQNHANIHRITKLGDERVFESSVSKVWSEKVYDGAWDGLVFALDIGHLLERDAPSTTRKPPPNEGRIGATTCCSNTNAPMCPAEEQRDEDAQDLYDCSDSWPDEDEYRKNIWLGDVRQAIGAAQFDYASEGSYRGERGSNRSTCSRQLIALHDSGIDPGWRVFYSKSEWRIFKEYRAIWPLWVEDANPIGGHGQQMAGVMIANGYMDSGVDEQTHTGIAPEAAVLSIAYTTDLYSSLSSSGYFQGSQACDYLGYGYTGWLPHMPAVQLAGEQGADIFVAAQSHYCKIGRFRNDCMVLAEKDHWCVHWDEQENVVGRPVAIRMDEAFSEGMLSILSSGNVGRNCDDPTSVDQSEDSCYPIGLGRSSLTALVVGAAYNNYWEDPPATNRERVQAMQEFASHRYELCVNNMGPTGDLRQYPLLLGYQGFCGVPAMKYTDDYGTTHALKNVEYYWRQFGGSSPATASVGGAATVLNEWLQEAFPEVGSSCRSGLLRTTLLNMCDRTACSDYHAYTGLSRFGGFGKVRLRLVDSCHFGNGGMEYHRTSLTEVGDTYSVVVNYNPFFRKGLMPSDLRRVLIAGWFELDAGTYEHATDRPFALVSLQKRRFQSFVNEPWETVVFSWTGEQFLPSSSSSSSYCTDYSDATFLSLVRDPHFNIALDNDWGEADVPIVEDGYEYRVVVTVLDNPMEIAVTLHISIIWESGPDLSLIENRTMGSWACPEPMQAPLYPLMSVDMPGLKEGRKRPLDLSMKSDGPLFKGRS